MFSKEDAITALGSDLRRYSGPEHLQFHGAAVDSRRVVDGDLFFALPGERTDGHIFVGDAIARGAVGVVVTDSATEVPDRVARFEVTDSLQALHHIARKKRDSLPDMRVIGVTGSVGKTSTKELIWQVVSRRFHAIRNIGSLNSETGLPMTLLAIDDAPQIAVLEMAMYVPGDIGLLCRIARPQIGVVTNVGVSHLARAGSLQAIIDAKAELPEFLPAGGLAVLNYDDANVRGMAARTRADVLTFGLQAGADVRASDIESHGLDGQRFVLHYGQRSAPVTSSVIGRHRLPNLLAAAAAGIGVGMEFDEIAAALAGADAEVRLRIVAGPGGSTIIDDTYNASPASVIGALNLLAEMPGRRLALLGDMRELGELEVSAHREVGERAARCCDGLYVVGALGKIIGEAAQAAGLQFVRAYDDKDQAVREIQPELKDGDFILVKASRALELDVAVSQLAGAKEAA